MGGQAVLAILAKQQRLGLCGGDHQHQRGVAVGGQISHAAGNLATGGGHLGAGGGVQVHAPGGHTALQGGEGGAAAHRAQADDAEGGAGGAGGGGHGVVVWVGVEGWLAGAALAVLAVLP